MTNHKISIILIDKDIQNHPYTEHILSLFPTAKKQIVESNDVKMQELSWYQSKRTIFLTTFPGSFIKDCPATSSPYLCCRYRILNPVIGCPFDCSYCILQHYLGLQPITVYVNWQNLYPQIQQYLVNYPNQLIRFGSGELTDSLALEPELGMVAEWVSFFSSLPNAVLELKTKSDEVDWLKSLPHGGKTVIAWSLNPSILNNSEERGADSVQNRIQAAAKVIQWGYRVAFHFDPILTVPGWEQLYHDLVYELCSKIPSKAVAWISLGSLRFPSPLKEIIHRRFPKSTILNGEWIRGLDGKYRLIKPQRIKMFRALGRWIKEGWSDDVYVYLCMESAEIWRESLGWEPGSRDRVEKKFQEFWQRKFQK
jgi:spore photoproduct lyase